MVEPSLTIKQAKVRIEVWVDVSREQRQRKKETVRQGDVVVPALSAK